MGPVKRLSRVCALFLVIGIVLELTLQVASTSSRVASLLGEPPAAMVADDILGFVGHPSHPDHDENGYRNVEVLEQADVVVLGDSQTYGTGVERSEAWPARLDEKIEGDVYSLALPGHGPAQHLLQLDRALALKPKTLVVTLYTGNDAYDCVATVHGRGQLQDLGEGDHEAQIPDLDARIDVAYQRAIGAKKKSDDRSSLRRFLADHSKLYGLMRAVKRSTTGDVHAAVRQTWEQRKDKATKTSGAQVIFEGTRLRTIFTPEYRSLALAEDDPCITEGKRLAILCLERIVARCEKAGVTPVVLLIPTKEWVYAEHVGELTPAHQDLVAREQAFLNEARAALGDTILVDGLTALRAPLADGQGSYPEHHDGHPNAVGHAVLAAAVEAVLP